MHRSLTVLLSLAIAASLSAAPIERDSSDPIARDGSGGARTAVRQYVIQPERVLSAADEASLEASGVQVQKVLGAGRYLVRTLNDGAIAQAKLLIRSAEELTPERKIHFTALNELAKPQVGARLNVIFDDAVSFDEAMRLITSAGGTLDQPMSYDFGPLKRLVARVPAMNVRALTSDSRVLIVYGAPKMKVQSDNASAANLSKVTPLFSAPYDLSGKDVMLSYFEIGSALATHVEFGGRLTLKFDSSSDADHATHVGGTMIAAGINPAAKGMAPAAKLTAYGVRGDEWLDRKNNDLKPLGVVGDNNSWGYVLGWNFDSDTGSWVWTGNAEYYGAYVYTNAAIDQIARNTNVLFVHSAGNDGTKTGPNAAPFAHKHEDDKGDTIADKTFCYSADGSGTDCPAPTCTAGPEYCEIIRHPVNAPLRSVGLTASSKNILTVGAASDATSVTGFSSRGPTLDGRVKPEIVAKGLSLLSTTSDGNYGKKSGTSMASPVITGISALLVEQWRRTFAGASPLAVTLKTLLIATADDMNNVGPDYTTGFGLANAKAAVDIIRDDNGTGSRIRVGDATQGSQLEIPVTVASTQKLRVALGWFDPEVLGLDLDPKADIFAASPLVNDLDIKVIGPNGATVLPYVLDKNEPEKAATRGVNKVDTTELVEITDAAPGTYRVFVSGTRIAASSPQQFVVVANAALAAAVVPCTDPTEPNNTAETGYGLVASSQAVMARLCAADDVDFFRFRPDRPGVVSVVVTATGTALRATLAGNGGETTLDLAAGESKTLQLNFTGNTPIAFNVRVQSTGDIAADTRYFVTPTFGLSAPARRRVR